MIGLGYTLWYCLVAGGVVVLLLAAADLLRGDSAILSFVRKIVSRTRKVN